MSQGPSRWEGCEYGTMDLSTAYDCIPHNLLISKLTAYGFDYYSLLLIHSYLSNRKQPVKMRSEFSDCVMMLNPGRQLQTTELHGELPSDTSLDHT